MLEDKIKGEYLGFILKWYADDFNKVGSGPNIKPTISRIDSLVPADGLFLKLEKSQFVLVPGFSAEVSRASMALLYCRNWEVEHQVGEFVGSDEAK